MKYPKIPADEAERLENLNHYDILDSEKDEEFDEITRLASEICGTPISLVTLVDDTRQWFKSRHGLEVDSTSREYAFCAHNLTPSNDPLIVNDATQDERFFDNPLVTGYPKVIFYAGVPLVSKEGFVLGSLCVIDNFKKEISESQIGALKILSKQVVKLIELRKANKILRSSQRDLQLMNQNLSEFAHIVSHDLKSPLRHINQYAQILREDLQNNELENIDQYLDVITDASVRAKNMINGVLRYSKAVNKLSYRHENIVVSELIEKIFASSPVSDNLSCRICIEENEIRLPRIMLTQILANLIGNACKYNDTKNGYVVVIVSSNETDYHFQVEDNGIGIKPEETERIFSLFYQVERDEKQALRSDGVGLNIVKKLVSDLGGSIEVSSQFGSGTTFSVRLPKMEK